MARIKSKEFIIGEGDESFDRSIRYDIRCDGYRHLSNLILTLGYYNQAGMMERVKRIEEQILIMDDISTEIKKEIKDSLVNLLE